MRKRPRKYLVEGCGAAEGRKKERYALKQRPLAGVCSSTAAVVYSIPNTLKPTERRFIKTLANGELGTPDARSFCFVPQSVASRDTLQFHSVPSGSLREDERSRRVSQSSENRKPKCHPVLMNNTGP